MPDAMSSEYVATIGFFDGVHCGHRYLIDCLRKTAQEQGMKSAVVTFPSHPRQVLGEASPALLTTYDERRELLRETGIDDIFWFNFSAIQSLTAAEFMQLLSDHYHVRVLLMGYDHRFGSDRLSGIEAYRQAAEGLDICIQPIPQSPEGAVSSSAIRQALLSGEIEKANEMLGYTYSLRGSIVCGNGIGRQIGVPTANIQVPQDKLVPRSGVYAVEAEWGTTRHSAIANIGTNPTIGNHSTTIEVHIPGFEGSLYGQKLSIQLLRYLRPEKKFATLEDLRRQIERDIQSL